MTQPLPRLATTRRLSLRSRTVPLRCDVSSNPARTNARFTTCGAPAAVNTAVHIHAQYIYAHAHAQAHVHAHTHTHTEDMRSPVLPTLYRSPPPPAAPSPPSLPDAAAAALIDHNPEVNGAIAPEDSPHSLHGLCCNHSRGRRELLEDGRAVGAEQRDPAPLEADTHLPKRGGKGHASTKEMAGPCLVCPVVSSLQNHAAPKR